MLFTKIFQSPPCRGLFVKQVFNLATTAKALKTCYYKVLNISADASADEIKQSYRELAKKYHPDVMTGETIQEGKFLEISEAYQILSDPTKRQQYDYDNGFASKHTKKGGAKAGQDKTAHFGDFGFTEESPPTDKEKEELDNYFQKKYFKNKDYFKYKIDEDSPWNMTRKLYNQAMDNKERAQSEHVLFNDGSHPYYASKEELKYDKNYHIALGVLYDYRALIAGGVLLAGGIFVNEMYFKSQENENKSNKKGKPVPIAR